MMQKKNKLISLSVFALSMLMVDTIDSLRNFPTAGLFAEKLLFFVVFGAIFFLIPVALVSADLACSNSRQKGIYGWVREAFGEKLGVLAIWLQWVNTVVWFPTILAFIAATFAYFLHPSLANNKWYNIAAVLALFWIMTLINLKGLKASFKLASWCAILGVLLPVGIIFILGAVWLYLQYPLQLHLHLGARALLPSFSQPQSFISLTAVMTIFLGMELASVHVQNIKDANNRFPKALLYAVIIIILSTLVGSMVIAMVVPHDKISLTSGVLQAFDLLLSSYHLHFLLPLFAIMILINGLGEMINWIISPIKGLLHAGQNGYLPKYLLQENKHGVAGRLLITQAVVVSLICLAFLLMPTVNGSYWLLTDLSTELYVLMYVVMFAAAIYLKYKGTLINQGFCIYGHKPGAILVCLMGLVGCLLALAVGFLPPTEINVGSNTHFVLIFLSGLVLLIMPVLGLLWYNATQK